MRSAAATPGSLLLLSHLACWLNIESTMCTNAS